MDATDDSTAHSPPVSRYREIADDLRRRIDSGEFPVGTKLPTYAELRREYNVGGPTIEEAVNVLRAEGLVRSARRLGTVVLDREDQVHRLDRGNAVRRNEYGYIFNAGAGHWPPIAMRPPAWVEADDELAARLDIDRGTLLLVRWRVVGPDKSRPYQLTRTFVVEDVARGTVIEQVDTGPGGWMDRVEHDLGHGPLDWAEYITSRLPDPEEAKALKIDKEAPVLVLSRVATSGSTGKPIAVDVTVMSGRMFEVRHPIGRDRSARWPTTPAADRNKPR
ncbi:GntR family transcriptional regulator [Kitasatospora cineracea]|uniref:GntR family transcriptional regulator n=1 Tax=Kitasatospora cineracea TaxID=88074 RepID=A0A3N4R201_9ACTN|nr:GntR family transcriptional regulator [Kitasatospora cineracea]RPE26606.1 GntR family transcriptional regulator [Kitasatospora cineracea]